MCAQTEIDIENHVLPNAIRLSDGTYGKLYTRHSKRSPTNRVFVYDCNLCGVANMSGERCFQTHISGRKHQTKLKQPNIDATQFRKPINRMAAQSKYWL